MPDPAPVVAPPRWSLRPWARALRRPAHWWFVDRQVRRLCSPLSVEGLENLAEVNGPAIFIANHTSHFDAYLVPSVLPPRLRYRAAMAAAADRWYARKKRHMEAFKFGVAILALGQRVPVVPIHLAGTTGILPPGERRVRRAPVSVRIGAPLTFEPDTSLQEAVLRLEEVVRVTAGAPQEVAVLSSTGA